MNVITTPVCLRRDNLDGLHRNTKDILDGFSLDFDSDDILVVQWVCQIISNRCALLVSVCEYRQPGQPPPLLPSPVSRSIT